MMGNGSNGPASTTARYQVRHETRYEYSNNVAACQNQLRVQPITAGSLVCHDSTLEITPTPTSLDQHYDYFGNLVKTFAIEATHRSLQIVVESNVSVSAPQHDVTSVAWQTLRGTSPTRRPTMRLDEYRFDSPRIHRGQFYAEYAAESFDVEDDAVRSALDLTKRIQSDFKYDTTATTVDTTTAEAFALRAGVCQDFAHILIACLRSWGLPARYVSGYLRTVPPPGKEKLVGADESHAWAELYAGEQLGWVGLDPTNGCLVKTDHIPVCVGRDYNDVSPMRGVILGGGTNTLVVKVDVNCLDDCPQPNAPESPGSPSPEPLSPEPLSPELPAKPAPEVTEPET